MQGKLVEQGLENLHRPKRVSSEAAVELEAVMGVVASLGNVCAVKQW